MSGASRWDAALVLALGLLLGGSGAWLLGRAPLKVQLAQLQTRHAEQAEQAARKAAKTLEEAMARGDALSAGLLAQQDHINQLTQERRHAVSQVTTGQPCLGLPALRLLDGAPGLSVAGLPPATGGAAAAGEPIASDTDVAGWALGAGGQYEVCRARLDALIAWHGAPADAPAVPGAP